MLEKIKRNKARCRFCRDIMDATNLETEDLAVCHCGSLAIGGGRIKLTRIVNNWGALQEMSESEKPLYAN